MFQRRDQRYLLLAVVVVLVGLFNSGLDDELAAHHPTPNVSFWRQPLVDMGYHFRSLTREELFYRCFGEMALGRQHDRELLSDHRGDLEGLEDIMLGPKVVEKPVMPYRDYAAEYPPVNFPFVVVPSLAGEKAESYGTVYRLLLAILNVVTLLLSIQLAQRFAGSPSETRRFLLLSLLSALLLGPIMTTRLDSIALFFFVSALVATTRERPVVAGICLALATGAKIVPVFLIPFFFLHWWLKGERGRAVRLAVSSAGAGALIFIPPLLAGPAYFRALFQYHGVRPIQAESTYGLLLRLGELFLGTPVELVHSYGSWNLAGPGSTAMASAATFLAVGVVVVLMWVYGAWLTQADSPTEPTREYWLLRACAATVLGLMFFSKVFSPQYLTWLWPWLFLADRSRSRVLPAASLLLFFLTQLIAQPYASDMVHGGLTGTMLLAMRNFGLLLLVWWLARRPEPLSEPETGECPDFGRKMVFLPFGLALLALLVHLQSRALESEWLASRAEAKHYSFPRIEFDGPLRAKGLIPFHGYSGLEMDSLGRTFCWTDEQRVEHFLPVVNPRTDHILELHALHALNPDFEQGVKLEVNGRPVTIRDGEGWPRTYSAWIPSDLLNRGFNRFTLITPDPVKPEENDVRELGLRVDWISLSPVLGFAHFSVAPTRDILNSFPEGWVAAETVAPVWLYRPGNFSTDFARLPVGSGWSEGTADRGARATRYLEGEGHLEMTLPSGRTRVTFTVLKETEGEDGPEMSLSIDGTPLALTRTESPWETSYGTEFDHPGGEGEFVFKEQAWWGSRPALGRLILSPVEE